MIELLPSFIQDMCPFVKVGMRLITKELVTCIRDVVAETGSVAAAVRVLQSQHIENYHRTAKAYYAACHQASYNPVTQTYGWEPERFSAFEDADGWAGVKVSRRLVRRAFLLDATLRENYLDRRMQMQEPGPVLKVDASYKASKLIGINGNKPFDNVTCIMGQAHQILTFKFCEDESQETIRPMAEGLRRRMEQHGFEAPKVMYTDKCCSDANFYTSVYPSLKCTENGHIGEPNLDRVMCISLLE